MADGDDTKVSPGDDIRVTPGSATADRGLIAELALEIGIDFANGVDGSILGVNVVSTGGKLLLVTPAGSVGTLPETDSVAVGFGSNLLKLPGNKV